MGNPAGVPQTPPLEVTGFSVTPFALPGVHARLYTPAAKRPNGSMLRARFVFLGIVLAALASGCSSSTPVSQCPKPAGCGMVNPPVLVSVLMDWKGTEGFYASPFPNDSRTIDGFPN